jgi:uncharacterized protein (UPF0332 family)
MTGENRRQNIADEVARAAESFREVRTLLDAKLPNGAVSRTYYAVFHLMRAAVLSRGVDPKTHAGALHQFNHHLTKPGLLPPFNRLIAGLQRSREMADYEAAVSFTLDEARSMLDEAIAFSDAVLDLLRREGWIQE